MFGTGQDVSERKAAEEERAQLIREQSARAEAETARRRSAFLAEVSATLAESLDYDAVAAAAARLAVPEVAIWCTVYTLDEGGLPQVAALEHAEFHDLPHVWLLGWSFGTDLALMHGLAPLVEGAVLLSPPLPFSAAEHLAAWAESEGMPAAAACVGSFGMPRPPFGCTAATRESGVRLRASSNGRFRSGSPESLHAPREAVAMTVANSVTRALIRDASGSWLR
jgi:hypothetical protein